MTHSPFLSRLSITALTLLLFTLPAYAILDTNDNGMSDIWERLYHDGELFDSEDPDHAPHADPDGDGMTNLQESIAGTNPFKAEPPGERFGITLQPFPQQYNYGYTYELNFPSKLSKQYRVHYSFDLDTWQILDSPTWGTQFPGTGAEIEYGVQIEQADGSTPPRLFWRVEVLDVDSDSDGLTDWEEALLNLNPESPQTIQGISDQILAEIFYHELVGFSSFKEVIDQLDINNPPPGSSDSSSETFLGQHFDSSATGERWISLRGSAEEDVALQRTKTITLPKGESALFVVAVASQEYDEYTGQNSEFNDELTWEIKSISDSTITLPTSSPPINVNDRHAAWENFHNSLPGLSPAYFEVVELVTAPAETDLTIEIKLTATNIGDSILPSTIAAGFMPVQFKTYPDTEPGPDKAHKKNISTRQDETAKHGIGWEKVVCKIWNSSPGKVSLIDYLDGGPDNHSVFENVIKWRVDGIEQASHELLLGDKPDPNKHTHFYVQVMSKVGSATLDRLIITVVPPETKTNFDNWYAAESTAAGKAWFAECPRMPSSLEVSPLLAPDRLFKPRIWRDPDAIDTYFHPDAYYEIRAKKTPGGHGHQVTFTDTGALILTGVSAGTADKAAAFPENWNWNLHVDADVIPFMWALQLDGNPCDQSTTTLTMPMLHEGAFIKRYLECRPPEPNAKPRFTPGGTP